ncbi:MAG: hypothetical protein NZ561_12885 [Phycisphaerae bacterium]|nr:hypothetical protein [Phycisphaerae bacterium]MDW8260985.1 rod shape-determining protein MreC [Phycisphaerales bacterium]
MTRFRSNQFFAALMFLAFLTAFFVPHRISDRVRANLQALFAPVALPTRYLAARIHQRITPTRPRDDGSPERPRDAAVVYHENDQLRVELANVIGQLEYYKTLASERDKLGRVRDLCSPFSVMGADAGARDSISIVGPSASRLKPGTVVLSPAGIIGRIGRAGAGAAQVQLLTDRQSRFTAAIGRYVESADGLRFEIAIPPTLIVGAGQGKMHASMIEWKYVEAGLLRENDWCVLDDPAWPGVLKWYRVGRVASVRQSRSRILFADVTIEPVVDARQLREVMVMDR